MLGTPLSNLARGCAGADFEAALDGDSASAGADFYADGDASIAATADGSVYDYDPEEADGEAFVSISTDDD